MANQEHHTAFSIGKSNNFMILFIGIDGHDCSSRFERSPHARHDCDLFATYVAFLVASPMFSEPTMNVISLNARLNTA